MRAVFETLFPVIVIFMGGAVEALDVSVWRWLLIESVLLLLLLADVIGICLTEEVNE